MKPLVVVLALVFSFFSSVTYSQGVRDIFDPKSEMTWLGLDFTAAKFFGDREKLGTESDIRKLILLWNNLMINEPDKFDVGKALDRPPFKEAIHLAIEHNEKLNIAQMVEDSKGLLHMSKEDVQQIVSSYNFNGLTGIGVLFVVESFSKFEEKGFIWVTFINLKSKEVLFTDRIIGDPSGIGLRNYWGGAIYSVLKKMKTNQKTWSKKYGVK